MASTRFDEEGPVGEVDGLPLEERLDAVVSISANRPAPTSTTNHRSSRFSAFMRSCTAMMPSVSARPTAAMTTAVRLGQGHRGEDHQHQVSAGGGVAGQDQVQSEDDPQRQDRQGE